MSRSHRRLASHGSHGLARHSAKPFPDGRPRRRIRLLIEELEQRAMLQGTPLLTPDQVREAYGVDDIQFGSGSSAIVGNGAGQTIAIIDAFDDPAFVNTGSPNFATSDLGVFDSMYNLPDPPSFTVVSETGGPRPTYSGETATNLGPNDQCDTGETAQDIEWAHAMAPEANIVLIEMQNFNDTDIGTALAVAVPAVKANIVSMSFGGGEYPSETDSSTANSYAITSATESGGTVTIKTAGTDYGVGNEVTITGASVAGYDGSFVITSVNGTGTSFTYTDTVTGLAAASGGTASVPTVDDGLFTEPNVTYIASSGDQGEPPAYPSTSPNVIAAGATNLNVNADNSYSLEDGWSNPPGIVSASEVGSTVTITTVTPTGFAPGNFISISGEGAGYDGTGEFEVASTPTPTSFTYVNSTLGLAPMAPVAITSAVENPNQNPDGTYEVTITTSAPLDLSAGDCVTIAGVGVAGYDGVQQIDTVLSPTSFEYSDQNGPLTSSSGGTVTGTAFGTDSVGPSGENIGGTSGGVSPYERQPSYQQGTGTKVTQSTTNRTTPDVSFVGGTATPVAAYDTFEGGVTEGGGTSLSAPGWAGLIAIADQGLASAGLPDLSTRQALTGLYDLPTFDFHDITDGYNGYYAGPGYDLVTGIGSPVANQLLIDLDNTVGTVAGPLNYEAPESYTAAGAPIANNIELTLNGANIQIFDNGSLVASQPLANTTSINIYGGDSVDNTLLVNFAGGNMIPSGGLYFDGESYDSGGTVGSSETLELQGTFTSNVNTPSGPNSGTIVLNGTTTITYANCVVGTPPPLAVNDTATVNEDSSVAINVLANDQAYGATLVDSSVTIVSQPAHGAVSVNPTTGVVTYTPALGYVGSDSFQYTVSNSNGQVSNAATVSISVANAPPVANNDSATLNENSSVVINVLANDTTLIGSLVPSSVTIVSQPAHGTVSVNPATGAVTYTPAVNYVGSDSFQYTVSNSFGLVSNAATVSITVLSIAPVAGNDWLNTPAGVPLSINLLSLVMSPYNDIDPTSFQIVSGATNGTVTLGAMGMATYTPNSGYIGGDSFTYRVANTYGVFSNVGTVTVIVGPIGSLSGFVYVDANDNGVMDPGEDGIGGVTVTLLKTDGSFLFTETTTTAANGMYTFGILPGGEYTITETQPAMFVPGQNTAGTIAPAGPSAADQFANIALPTGVNATGYDFGELGLRAAFVQAYLTEKVFFASANQDPTDLNLGGGSVYFSFDAGINGTLSVQGSSDGSGSLQFVLLNNNLQVVASSAVSSTTASLTYTGSVGQPYFLEVTGTSTSASMQTSISNNLQWHNATNPLDVIGDGALSPLDALTEIALLKQQGAGPLDQKAIPVGEYPDVLGTNELVPLDVLDIISALNAMSVAAGSGSSGSGSSGSGSSGSGSSGSGGSGSVGASGGTVFTLIPPFAAGGSDDSSDTAVAASDSLDAATTAIVLSNAAAAITDSTTASVAITSATSSATPATLGAATTCTASAPTTPPATASIASPATTAPSPLAGVGIASTATSQPASSATSLAAIPTATSIDAALVRGFLSSSGLSTAPWAKPAISWAKPASTSAAGSDHSASTAGTLDVDAVNASLVDESDWWS